MGFEVVNGCPRNPCPFTPPLPCELDPQGGFLVAEAVLTQAIHDLDALIMPHWSSHEQIQRAREIHSACRFFTYESSTFRDLCGGLDVDVDEVLGALTKRIHQARRRLSEFYERNPSLSFKAIQRSYWDTQERSENL